MKKLHLMVFLIGGLLLSSCGTLKSYTAFYSVGLSAVESPANAKQQFGETKVVTFDDNGVSKYRYEDDYINIVWYVSPTKFNFTLNNKSNYSLKINWDDISFVNTNGQVGRVMHSGVKYSERNNSQPATTVPKGAKISDILLPTSNVSFISGQYGGWVENYLFPCVYKTPEAFNAGASSLIGKTMSIMMPIMIESVQNDYTFTFNIDRLLNSATK